MIQFVIHVTRHFLFWFLIIFAIVINLIRILLLDIEDYKIDLERKIQDLTTIPVEIGVLQAKMRGFSPELILKKIHVKALDEMGQPTIKLDQVRLGVDLMQLVVTQDIIASSWFTFVGAELSIIRKKDGTLSVVGLNSKDSEQPFWLFQGGRYELLKSHVSWLDEQSSEPPVEFYNVNLLIKNDIDSESHEIHLVSHLPQQVGKELRVSLAIQGNVFETENLNVTAYIEGKNIKLAKLLTDQQLSGINISTGESNFKLWTQWKKSRLLSLAGNIQAKNLGFVKHNKKQFQINSVKSEFNGLNKDDGWQVGINNFVLETGRKIWPSAKLVLSANNELTQFSGFISQLDLQEVNELALFFAPLTKEKHQLISSLAVQGTLNDFSFYTDSEKDHYAFIGEFENLFINDYSDLPQLENFKGFIKGNDDEGVISLNTQSGAFYYPRLFKQPFAIKHLSGLLRWQDNVDHWHLSSDRMILDTKDIFSETRIAITMSKDDEAIFMDLHTSFNAESIHPAPNYYPSKIMDKDVLYWLDNAFVSGKIGKGNVLLYGDLQQFPFSAGQGVFEVLYNMEDVELKYAPEWPNLKKLAADILFLKGGITVDISHAEVNNLKVKQALIEIPSFEKSNHLLVHGQAEGRIIDSLRFLQQTPLHKPVNDILSAITPSGLTTVNLDLKIPLSTTASQVVNGVAYFDNAALKVESVGLNITKLNGHLKFSDKGLFSKKIKAKALGNPIELKVDSNNVKTAINIVGDTNIQQLQHQFSFLNNDFIDKHVKGSINYQMNLDLPFDEQIPAELSIRSNFLGLSLDLPGSLKKPVQLERPFLMNLLFDEGELLPLRLNYNDRLKAAININKEQETLHSANIVYGSGNADSPIKPGINIRVQQESFNISEWINFLQSEQGDNQRTHSDLRSIYIKTQQLKWDKNNYGAFEIEVQNLDQKWQGKISCSVAKGHFDIPFDKTGNDKIKLDMAYVNLSELFNKEIPVNNLVTQEMPLFKISSQQLWWNNIDLGALTIETERLLDGVKFNPINLSSNEHAIDFNAVWMKNGRGSTTEMTGSLSADDFGSFLSRIGFANDLKESRGNIHFSGTWPGAPYQFSLSQMEAEVDLELEKGRITSIEPGFGRLLGLLAMEQWIKRLTLDFGDLYKQGLSFNSISGHFNVSGGKARSQELVVNAVPARITLSGKTDLLTKKLDYNVLVVPKSAGAVPIAGTIVGRIAGTITEAVTSDYQEGYFFGSKYKVTGQWDNIKIEPLHDQDGILKKTWKGLTDFSWIESVVE